MRKITLAILSGAVCFFPAIAAAQHTAPGAPLVQGQQRHPETFVAPFGSAPEIGQLNDAGDMIALTMSDLEGVPVVNEFGQPIGTASQVVEGDAGFRYVVVLVEDQRAVVFPVVLMGVHGAGLVVQGYGQDLVRAKTLEPNALAGFNPVHPSRVIEMPQVALREE